MSSKDLVFDSLCLCTLLAIYGDYLANFHHYRIVCEFSCCFLVGKRMEIYGNPHQVCSPSGYRPLAKWLKPFAARLQGVDL